MNYEFFDMRFEKYYKQTTPPKEASMNNPVQAFPERSRREGAARGKEQHMPLSIEWNKTTLPCMPSGMQPDDIMQDASLRNANRLAHILFLPEDTFLTECALYSVLRQ